MEWANIVKKGLHSNIITVKYDSKNNCIKLDLITDEAKKTLKINDPDDFKIFSRRTIILNNYQESKKSEISNVKIEDQKTPRNNIGDKFEKNNKKMTLENKIISIVKQYSKNKQEEEDKNKILRFKRENSFRQKQKTVDSKTYQQYITQQDQIQDILYGEYEKDDLTEKKMISVKNCKILSQIYMVLKISKQIFNSVTT
ncbi:hypothetical protein TTHERM_00894430 (macronuclear) [Tetrahymena thermophila SB210]|uniref:Uncharacterized protein n=1 Tax=Tetrahymena thermophila (strain SB210) TaxID=312017 RepID=Q23U51_TETTS|nr:hypothetical protein TTHERM_00894430 [Tetrahymena thermophila SB210]EAS00093.2 hypothetical protein TTHERM_00894430 [Tetrahymena thermophila SB210]|eukprot:XP_001020338.2 hypothetical protein TTHERM_00894430 [Tetrahymena thermophila SB210]